MKIPSCPNSRCRSSRKASHGDGVLHGFYRVKSRKRRRYRCKVCGRTFCSNQGTPYYRLQHQRSSFDQVASLSVKGLSKSAIARVAGLSWNTVDRWLEKAASSCTQFNHYRVNGLEIRELQADEIRTFVAGKDRATWIFTTLDVWSRLWPSTVVGRRSYRNRSVLRDTMDRMKHVHYPLVVTDGFEFYEKVIRHHFKYAVLYAQVMKTRRNDRVVRIERREILGPSWRFEQALFDSEDSTKLNTSFIERLNLTIRQGSAFLCRRTLSYARSKEKLGQHLELFRCHYNFVRRHRGLKFGREMRTPAMQAGLTSRPLTFRDIFTSCFSFSTPQLESIMFPIAVSVRRMAA